MGNMLVVLWFGEIFWNKTFFPSTPKIRSLKDKSEAKFFTTGFQKAKSNPGWREIFKKNLLGGHTIKLPVFLLHKTNKLYYITVGQRLIF